MSGLPRARIVRGQAVPGATGPEPLFSPLPSPAWRRRVGRDEIEARLEAERIVLAAGSQAEAVIARAREQAAALAEQTVRDAHEQAEAKLAACWLVLRQAEEERLERDRDHVIAVATVLAERLIGAALELEPSRVLDLARVAMAEARGARRISIDAHPLDADTLRRHLDAAGLSRAWFGHSAPADPRVVAGDGASSAHANANANANDAIAPPGRGQHLDGTPPQGRGQYVGEVRVEVRADETLARGELRLQTDVGTVDAKLSPRLERLAAALRDALPPPAGGDR